MEKGLVEMYYGNGKGKSTAAFGLALRALGHGMKVFIYQFLKDGISGEVNMLKSMKGVTYMENTVHSPFLFNLTPDQQEYFAELYQNEFERVISEVKSGNYDLCIIDEVIDAANLNLINKENLINLMDTKPANTELVITGHEYGEPLDCYKAHADYVTNFRKEKHPFDNGEGCRKGIEE
ncbi:MAG: cob(I)yrinic acid a,c-diamide adenosyltransferase [Lachnospiraceae bacterium]|nr:cob(I)yrinic acid a,c-diamide adenosyltransferase [Lachnospiraceae bacterium]